VYGVAIDPKTLKLDAVTTQTLRAKKRQANGNGAMQIENNTVLEVNAAIGQLKGPLH
jgi:hypothetical protein